MLHRFAFLVLALALVLPLVVASNGTMSAQSEKIQSTCELYSRAGAIADRTSLGPALSADGRYVVFQSEATNLVPGDTGDFWDIFVYDRQTSQTTLVSVSSFGVQANGDSCEPDISADGRYVVFESAASNLVAGDSNGYSDIFVRDLQSEEIELISVSSSGTQGNNLSNAAVLSQDGRYVAFTSRTSNLVTGDTNLIQDVFVHDRMTGETSRVSVNSSEEQGNHFSRYPAISADGRYVAFNSAASNLDPRDSAGARPDWPDDVFVRDRENGTTYMVSVNSLDEPGNHASYGVDISGDGRYVAFTSHADNLVPGYDPANTPDIFVRDTVNSTTTRASSDSLGNRGNSSSWGTAISADGRYVLFGSHANNLVPGDTNGEYDAFVHDRLSLNTFRVSVDSNGVQGNDESAYSDISADGRIVAFSSYATNLAPDDTNRVRDVFIHDRMTGATSSPTVGTNPDLDLAIRYAPIVRMHVLDRMIPMSVDVALQHNLCLSIQSDNSTNCDPDGAVFPITTALLASQYWIDKPDAYIDFKGNPHSVLTGGSQHYWETVVRNQVLNHPVTYAHVWPAPDGRRAIQYYFYYYYNNHPATLHEGDWEMIQVELGPDGKPEYATYSQHGNPTKRQWSAVQKIGDNPIIYPAFGSHASYFHPGTYGHCEADWTAFEFLNDQFSPIPDLVTVESVSDSWLRFKGHWGEKNWTADLPVKDWWSGWASSPANPDTNEVRWNRPLEWSQNAPFDEQAHHNICKPIIRVSLDCRVGIEDRTSGKRWGWFGDSWLDEIDLIEEIRNDTLQTTSIILHNDFDQIHEKYDIHLEGCSSSLDPNQPGHAVATDQLATVRYVASETTDVVTLVYGAPADWSSDTSTATVSLSSETAPALQVDLDGNGVVDTTQPPDSVDQDPLYPDPVTDFAANPLSGSGPLTVEFLDISTGYPTSWLWNFGDGQTSAEQHPTHTYRNDGYYTVSLTVTNPSGSDVETKMAFLQVRTDELLFFPHISKP